MYPEIYLNPEISLVNSVDELREIDINEWKANHTDPTEALVAVRNLKDESKAKVVYSTNFDENWKKEHEELNLGSVFREEDLQYILVIAQE